METVKLSDHYDLQIKTEGNEVKARTVGPNGLGIWHTIRLGYSYPDVPLKVQSDDTTVAKYRDGKRQIIKRSGDVLTALPLQDDEGADQ